MRSAAGLVLGNSLYVAELNNNRVSTYDATTGAAINLNFVTGRQVTAIAIGEVPEPSTFALATLGLLGMGFAARRKKGGLEQSPQAARFLL